MTKKIRIVSVALLLSIWALITVFAWFSPAKEASDTERRPLAQFPTLNSQTLLNGKFMADFDGYTLDQFPLRDTFRQLKALFHYGVLQQKDNNGIYVADGYTAKMEYPLQEDAVAHATKKLTWIYENLLAETDSKIFCAVVPDKSYYLAEENRYLSMDYAALFDSVEQALPWATHVDLTDSLSTQDYYFTDTHWRQENLLEVAGKLSAAMGVTAPKAEDFTQTALEKPFYGVYYGQAALPMEPETLYILENDLLKDCKVYNYTTQGYTDVYDMEKLNSKDMYDVFLSGPQSLLRIENPNAATAKELIIFRDSFGSSLAPLLVADYKTVTLVDIRYLNSQMLDRYLTFDSQDVLFLYSTLVLNNGTTLK